MKSSIKDTAFDTTKDTMKNDDTYTTNNAEQNPLFDNRDINLQNNEANSAIVNKILEQQPNEEILYELADVFKVFGDTTRIRILYALFENELCVGDIAQILNLSQSSVSHQLRILKGSKLVKFRREGKNMIYSLDDDHVRMILSVGMEHIEE